jgi:tetratricopeptide (TPR) repeat protein
MYTDARRAVPAAMAALAAGRSNEAESVYLDFAAARPALGEAQMLGGIVAARTGRPAEAITRFRAALALEPRLAAAHHWLALLLLEAGRPAEALPHARAAEVARPADPAVLDSLARAYEDLGMDGQAARTLRSLVLQVREFETLMRLGRLLVKLGRPGEAVEIYGQALALRPEAPAVHLALSRAQAELLQDEAAFRHLNRAAALDPESSAVPLRRALLLQSRGRFSEAETEFERAIAHEPGLGTAYYGIVAARRFTEADLPIIDRMKAALSLPDLSPNHRAHLHYAIGKAMDDLGRYEAAMAEFDAANQIEFESRVKQYALNADALAAQVDRRIATFCRDPGPPDRHPKRPRDLSEPPSDAAQPIFIVGMPRSGTTLVEQILSCHPDVAAAGEQSFWAHAEPRLLNFATGVVNEQALREAALEYQALLSEFAGSRSRVTDKNPANCMAIGVIAAAFPSACIIRVRRDAADTALSIYKTPWANPPEFACNKENIARFYEEYLRLMGHWRAVLPIDRYLEVSYEALVSESEPVVRGLLEFCGLDWQDACLHPYRNPRVVRTPSFWQVRQPLYRSSISRAARYAGLLGPLEGLIGRD